jgi:arsenate reductase (glutaredoxin)
MKTIIYHYPKCTKSREALALLEERGIRPEVVEYMETPPSAAELKEILKKLKLKARDILRTKEPEYKALGLEDPSLSEDQVIALIVSNPKLLERAIVVHGNKAAIGRPPENILKIL